MKSLTDLINEIQGEFDVKSSRGFFGAHMRDEEADWEEVKTFLDQALRKVAAWTAKNPMYIELTPTRDTSRETVASLN